MQDFKTLRMAASRGIEPRYPESKSGVLPLDEEAMVRQIRLREPFPLGRECRNCGNPLNSRQLAFCCRNCKNTKSHNPNWKGGISTNNLHYKLLFQARYPEKAKAHSAVTYAIGAGLLIKKPCEICDSLFDIHAHHEDYSKPLEVRWLCRMCHRKEHEK